MPANWRNGCKPSTTTSSAATPWPTCRNVPLTRGPRRSLSFTPTGGRRALPASARFDASIAAKADFEFLYDKPYEDKKRVVLSAGPFTVESISPHRAGR